MNFIEAVKAMIKSSKIFFCRKPGIKFEGEIIHCRDYFIYNDFGRRAKLRVDHLIADDWEIIDESTKYEMTKENINVTPKLNDYESISFIVQTRRY